MVAHVYNPSTWAGETRSSLQSQPELQGVGGVSDLEGTLF